MLGTLSQHHGVVDTLGSASYFLAPHEEVVGVGVVGVVRVQHRVEGADGGGVAVEHVEISIVFLLNKFSKCLLSLGRQIVKRLLLDAGFGEHLDALLEVKFEDWSLALEVFEWILLLDDFQLFFVSFLDSGEDVHEQVSQQVQHLKVVFLDSHLHVEASELAKMTIGVRVLSSKNWTDFEHSIEVSAQSHLLVELGTLGKASILAEVFHFENIGTALRSTTDQFWGVNLNESVLEHEFPVEGADT